MPIIFFNREPVEEDLKSWEKLYYVGTPADEPGAKQGQILLDLANRDFSRVDRNGDGILQYVLLEGEPNHQDALLRTESSIKVLTDAGIVMERLANDVGYWKLTLGYSLMSSWLNNFGEDIEVVVANNDDMALGAIQAYENSSYSHNKTLFLGFDGTPTGLQAVLDKKLYGTVLNDAVAQAHALAELTIALATNISIDSLGLDYLDGQYIRIPHRMVTIANIGEEIASSEEVR